MNVEWVEGGDPVAWNAPAAMDEAAVVIAMPYLDRAAATRSAGLMAARAGQPDGVVLAMHDTAGAGFVALANAAFRSTRSRYFGYAAQDAFAGRRWLQHAIAGLEKSGKGLLAFNDGKWMGMLAGFGLACRAWAAGNYGGDLFHPGYGGHYADTELTILAMSERQYCYDPNSVLAEIDWEKDGKAVSAADRALYHRRAAGGFDGRVSSPRLLGLFS